MWVGWGGGGGGGGLFPQPTLTFFIGGKPRTAYILE